MSRHHVTLWVVIDVWNGEEPHDVLIENVMASVSQYQREHNAIQVVNRMKARELSGLSTRSQAPHGYKQIQHPKYGKFFVKDEPLATLIQEALEGFASGRFATKKEFQQYLQTIPEFPKGKTGKVTYDQVKRLLTNVFYAGYLKNEKWEIPLTEAKHEAIITYDTYQKNQHRLKGVEVVRTRKDTAADFPLRGSVQCDCCGDALTSSWSKSQNGKHHPYYHCKNKSCVMYGKSIKRSVIESEFKELLGAISPSPKMLELTKAIIKDLNKAQEDKDST